MSLIELFPALCILGGLILGVTIGATHSVAGAFLGAILGFAAGLLFYFLAIFFLAVIFWIVSRASGQDVSLFTPKPKRKD